MKNNERTCPKCGQIYNEYPAISRLDNKTEICPDCGTKEALEQFIDYTHTGNIKYRKVIDIGNLPNKGTKIVQSGLVFNDECVLKDIKGYVTYPDGGKIVIPSNNISITNSDLEQTHLHEPMFNIDLIINNSGEIQITTSTDESSATGYVILYYEKYKNNDKQLEIAIIPMKKDNLIFEITNFGYLKASDLCDYLLDNFDFITKKMETVIPSLENFLIYGKPIERAFYNLEDNTIIIYYK